MVKSMTGFGRAEASVDGLTVIAEIRSVNHRFFDFSLRCPKNCQFLENEIKQEVRKSVIRGKVDLSITVSEVEKGGAGITLNREYADAYISALRSLAKDYKLKNDLSLSVVASNPEIFTVKREEADEEKLTEAVMKATVGAVSALVKMRSDEGKRLADDISSRTDAVLKGVEYVEERSPETVKEYRERLISVIKEVLDGCEPDEQRIVTEAAIYADKVAVAEETVRLRSHIEQLLALLKSDGEAGRKLDFIVQEMNRETNTIGSKAQDAFIASAVVDMKSEIEKIREQVQNIE